MNQPAPTSAPSAPRKAYADTQHWYNEMTAAQELDDLALAWELFLIYHQRTWNKCQNLYRGKSYWSTIVAEYSPKRGTDTTLVYVHQARHVDEHGVAPVSAPQAASTTISSGTLQGGSKIVGGGPSTVAPGSTATVTFNPATVVALPVTNRGQQYLPPVFPGLFTATRVALTGSPAVL